LLITERLIRLSINELFSLVSRPCVCVCVCVLLNKRRRAMKERKCVLTCVCVCERERERESPLQHFSFQTPGRKKREYVS